MTLSEELTWRGFINQSTFSDIKHLDKGSWTFYHGFDASADSQTIGNLAAMMFDKVFMRHGHKAILLAGGATSLIGDPGGKDSERPMQDETTILANVKAAEDELKQVFQGQQFTLVNNLDWFNSMTVLEFLRDIGKNFSMTPLVQRDYIAKRMGEGGSGISYTEFSYTLLQGYDFLHLHKTLGVNLQLSGSDQWGNCLSGVDLVRRETGNEVHALTAPLVINKTTGKKFGKSEDGAVWLNPSKTTPFMFYQFWLNVDDEGVEDYLKIYTELSKNDIDSIMHEFNKDRQARIAHKKLAYEVTKMVHGDRQAQQQQKITDHIVKQTTQTLDATEIHIVKNELPSIIAEENDTIIDLAVKLGLIASKGEARRMLDSGALYINGVSVHDPHLQSEHFDNGAFFLRKGKAYKNVGLVLKK